jgi:caa(3)-type oxidase subunit IV
LGCALSAPLSPADDEGWRQQQWTALDRPARRLGPLLVLFAVSWGSVYLPLGTGNIVVYLGIAAAMIAVLAVFLMDLRNSTALVRLVAAAGGFGSSSSYFL